MIYFGNELLIIDENLSVSIFEEDKGLSKLKRLTKKLNDTIKNNKSFIEAVGEDIAKDITFSIDFLTKKTREDYHSEVFRLFIPYTDFVIDYDREICEYEIRKYELFDTGKRIIKINTYEQDFIGATNPKTFMNNGRSPFSNKSLEEICLEALSEFVYREI